MELCSRRSIRADFSNLSANGFSISIHSWTILLNPTTWSLHTSSRKSCLWFFDVFQAAWFDFQLLMIMLCDWPMAADALKINVFTPEKITDPTLGSLMCHPLLSQLASRCSSLTDNISSSAAETLCLPSGPAYVQDLACTFCFTQLTNPWALGFKGDISLNLPTKPTLPPTISGTPCIVVSRVTALTLRLSTLSNA